MSAGSSTPSDALDYVAILYLAGGFADASNLGDVDRLVALWAPDGVFEIPSLGVQLAGTEELRAGFRRRLDLWEVMLQTAHPAAVEVAGNEARVAGVVHPVPSPTGLFTPRSERHP